MGLNENISTEPVSELSLRTPLMLSPSRTVTEAVQAMREASLGCVIVVDTSSKPLGIFTEAMLRNEMAHSPDVLGNRLEDEMATTYPWVRITDPIEVIVDAMEAKNARFVVVLDAEGQVVGLTGQKGLMEYIAEHFPGEVMVQRIGTEPYPTSREGA